MTIGYEQDKYKKNRLNIMIYILYFVKFINCYVKILRNDMEYSIFENN